MAKKSEASTREAKEEHFRGGLRYSARNESNGKIRRQLDAETNETKLLQYRQQICRFFYWILATHSNLQLQYCK